MSDDEIDPLDAYMVELNKTLNSQTKAASSSKATRVVVSSEEAPSSNKGEIIDNEDDKEQVVDDMDIEVAASSLLAKGRQLAQTDHAKVYYRPFRKSFYTEVPDLQRMTKKEVEEYREELDSIKVRGKQCPKPIKNWAQSGVEFKVLNILKRFVTFTYTIY